MHCDNVSTRLSFVYLYPNAFVIIVYRLQYNKVKIKPFIYDQPVTYSTNLFHILAIYRLRFIQCYFTCCMPTGWIDVLGEFRTAHIFKQFCVSCERIEWKKKNSWRRIKRRKHSNKAATFKIVQFKFVRML